MIHSTELWQAYQKAWTDLLAQRLPSGHWEGRLASSALATATAIGALSLVQRHAGPPDPKTNHMISTSLDWLGRTQNPDGGWGDTDRSPSNIATTMLVQAAVRLAGAEQRFAPLLDRAAQYIHSQGDLEGLRRRYGKDQTFAVPILTMCALAGLVSWEQVQPLPFEWAVLPHQVLGWVRLPVVSYAIPALVAMGQARFFHLPPRNPLLRWVRSALVEKTLQVLEAKQPASGGFLEAVPLTSFVLMALASTGRAQHPVVQRGVEFLCRTYRPEGAWPIDANLATWVTTLSLNALLRSHGKDICIPSAFDGISELLRVRAEVAQVCWPWLLECQHQKIHPFTASAPGGWGWTDLSGAVPDADDTAGALLALAAIERELAGQLSSEERRRILQAVELGLRWLLDLQNQDGGWPTFCRGWGALPFDRSATDLTAHALRALSAWKATIAQGVLAEALGPGHRTVSVDSIQRAIDRGLAYLARSQNPDGSWTPLWFGNAYWTGEENPIYGTARVLMVYRDLGQWANPPAQQGRRWLLAHQNPDGGWGGRPDQAPPLPPHPTAPAWTDPSHRPSDTSPIRARGPHHPGPAWTDPSHSRSDAQAWQSSVEETALAVEALLADPQAAQSLRQTADLPSPLSNPLPLGPPQALLESEAQDIGTSISRGLAWLVRAVGEGRHRQPEPIGLYFARLWYYEEMYPIIFTVSALGEAIGRFGPRQMPAD